MGYPLRIELTCVGLPGYSHSVRNVKHTPTTYTSFRFSLCMCVCGGEGSLSSSQSLVCGVFLLCGTDSYPIVMMISVFMHMADIS